jgi:putative inorganic carbon (HCO3(-)) transporter
VDAGIHDIIRFSLFVAFVVYFIRLSQRKVIRIPKSLSLQLILFYGISVVFILLIVVFFGKKLSYFFSVLPFVFAILLMAIFSADKLLWLVVLFTPLSLPLTYFFPGISVNLYLPTEPFLFGILLLYILKLSTGYRPEKAFLKHPVTIATGIYLLWILITSITSTMPLVSIKFWTVKIWFIVGFYLMGIQLFENRINYPRMVWLYTGSLILVIGYTTARHLGYGLFDKQAAHFVMNPFYNDHTSYGAVIAMFIPFLIIFSFSSFYKSAYRWLARAFLLILFIAFFLSYARATWLSLIAAFAFWIIIKLRIRFRTMAITAISVLALILMFQKQLVMYLERNNEESSANLIEHFSSISNISSDASNLERINRWSCAIRMFGERPVFGFGPGTYMFRYAPYQLTRERTIISTNAGDLGNAHSEYLGPLAESGLFGMLSFLALVISVIYTAFRTYTKLEDPGLKACLIGAILGLITYYSHGLLNNFLDTDKASVPFWGFTAMIVSIDLLSRKMAELKKTE